MPVSGEKTVEQVLNFVSVNPSATPVQTETEEERLRTEFGGLLNKLAQSGIPKKAEEQLQRNLEIFVQNKNSIKIVGNQIIIDGQIGVSAEMLTTLPDDRAIDLSKVCSDLASGQEVDRKLFEKLDTSGGERLRFMFHLDMVDGFMEKLGMDADNPPPVLTDMDALGRTRMFDLVNENNRGEDGNLKQGELSPKLLEASKFSLAMNPDAPRQFVEYYQFYTNFANNAQLAASWNKQKQLAPNVSKLQSKIDPLPGDLQSLMAEIAMDPQDQKKLMIALGLQEDADLQDVPAHFKQALVQKHAELQQSGVATKDEDLERLKSQINADNIKKRLSDNGKLPVDPNVLDEALMKIAARTYDEMMKSNALKKTKADFKEMIQSANLIPDETTGLPDIEVVRKAYLDFEKSCPEPAPVDLGVNDLWDEDAVIDAMQREAGQLLFGSKAAAIYHAEKHFAELLTTGFPEVVQALNGAAPEKAAEKSNIPKTKAAFVATLDAGDKLALYIHSAQTTIPGVTSTPEVKIIQSGARMVFFNRKGKTGMRVLVFVGATKQASIATYMAA